MCLMNLYSFCSALQRRADHKPDCFIIRLEAQTKNHRLRANRITATPFQAQVRFSFIIGLTVSLVLSENSPRPHSSLIYCRNQRNSSTVTRLSCEPRLMSVEQRCGKTVSSHLICFNITRLKEEIIHAYALRRTKHGLIFIFA